MYLTSHQRPYSARPNVDSDAFPTTQLALLALVRVAEPIALTSILPYAWRYVLSFHIGDESHASLYAGLLIAAFALAESLTGMWWGVVSDKVGRKPVLLFGCAGTILSLLIVGLAPNFWIALLGRAVGGLLNGNIGVIQTMVGELVTRKEHEPRAYAVMPFVWSVGTTLGPALGGYFANPCENFPSVFHGGIFERFPYLLPNLICSLLMLVAIIAGVFLIKETHPDKQPWSRSSSQQTRTETAETPLVATAGAMEHSPSDLRAESYGTFNSVKIQDCRKFVTPEGRPLEDSEVSRPSLLSRRIIMLIVALGLFTYHSMTYDTLISVFLEDDRGNHVTDGGLGLSIKKVGAILAVNGIIAMFIQGVIFPLAASRFGVWKLFVITTIGHPLAYFIVPYLAFLPQGGLYPGIYTCLAIRNLFSIIAYPVLLILIKEASPDPSYLGKINGLAASVGAACRTVASPVGGCLYGLGIQIQFTPLAWWASAFVAVIGAVQIIFIKQQKEKKAIVRAVTEFTEELKADDNGDSFAEEDVVHIVVQPHERYYDNDDVYEDERLGLYER